MKIKNTKKRLNSYLKKRALTIERYNDKDNVSKYLFIADRDDYGTNQIVYQTGYRYDKETDISFIEEICIDLHKQGYKNIHVEQKKKYYKKSRNCQLLILQCMTVFEYKFA